VVTHQLQVERRTGKVRQSETDVLPLCHATNRALWGKVIMRRLAGGRYSQPLAAMCPLATSTVGTCDGRYCRYMLCADYEDYIRVQEQVGETFLVR